MAEKPQDNIGLNILCLDGGGARGLSSLVVLREIMHRANFTRTEGVKPLDPHELFDMIAGTGTGGISACMLGRLLMSIDKAITEYTRIMETAFSEKKMSGPTLYKGTKLQEALKTMVRNAAGNEEATLIEGQASRRCKTAVFAMARHNMNASIPILFRSYDAATNPGPGCTIWQALHATMAHPELFKGIDILDTSVSQSFIGGEVGCSNPLAHVLTEVRQLYPTRRIACIVSIGAGHARTIQVPNPSWWQLVPRTRDLVVMKDMATDSERVAEEMTIRFRGRAGVYYRFNVDQGMQDMKDGSWERLGEVVEHTRVYLQTSRTDQKLDEAARTSVNKRGVISTPHAAGQVPNTDESAAEPTDQATSIIKRVPAPTAVYTGREDENIQVITCIIGGDDERRVCVIYGLGGVGKTQLVLSVIERTRDQWDHVIFVDASSNATVETDLKDFATANGIGSSYQETMRWLETCRQRWLVVLDNADTPSTNIRQYIPSGRHGSVLITTRLPDLDRLAKGPGSVCHLSSMSNEDGLALFMKAARVDDHYLPPNDINCAKVLLKDFGGLALAIVHAGAYIAHSPGMTFTKYRDLFLSQRQRMLEQYSQLPASAKLDDYGKTVYTTWKMCYDQLQAESRTMLWLMSYLHYSHISEDIFERAAQNVDQHSDPLPLNDLESRAQNHVTDFLSNFMGSDKCWDTVRFTSVMADLRLYSLIDYDRMNFAYSIHVLVQDWARTVQPHEQALGSECTATLLSLSIDYREDTGSLAFKRRLSLHITSLLRLNYTLNANHSYHLSRAFWYAGQWSELERLCLQAMEAFKRELGDNHSATLDIMGSLANAYKESDRPDQAEQIEVQVLESSKRVLGEEHPHTSIRKANLARTYSRLGRLDEAEQLQLQLLDVSRRIQGEEHPDTLAYISYLSMTYLLKGRLDEATELKNQVLEARKRVLGEDHPETLNAMAGLAQIYSRQGRWDEAELLLTGAATIAQQQLGAEHPHSQRYSRWLGKVQKRRRL
ncbi:unnamed protein product [Rhizoctonia solani]|uniref:PNPLA domain-containing protein n=1 Tax=Rhizoctonia solani TaxID=456999 RepID=A0A8H3HUZ2_9AGAM|nr:unnamed protein product [Rhizoctonia solani]